MNRTEAVTGRRAALSSQVRPHGYCQFTVKILGGKDDADYPAPLTPGLPRARAMWDSKFTWVPDCLEVPCQLPRSLLETPWTFCPRHRLKCSTPLPYRAPTAPWGGLGLIPDIVAHSVWQSSFLLETVSSGTALVHSQLTRRDQADAEVEMVT